MTVPTLPAAAKPRSLSTKDAVAQGRRLAGQVAERVSPGAEGSVEALARGSVSRLRQMGVEAEVLRSRSGCLVVRSAVRPPGDAAWACALVSGWLEALPGAAHGVKGTLVESTCASRGGRSCIHTLMWQQPTVNPTPPVSGRSDPPAAGPLDPLVAEAQPTDLPPWAQLAPTVPVTDHSPPPAPIPNHAPPPVPIPQPEPTAPLATVPAVVSPVPPVPSSPPAAVPPVPPVPPAPPGVPHEPAVAPLAPLANHDRAPRRATGRWPWAKRRAWLLVVGLLAGLLGGYAASAHSATDYGATAVVVVHGGSSTAAASSANGAAALAVTYAALVPSDQALLMRVAAKLGVPATDVARHLSVEAESGTSLIDVKFTDANPALAVAGANDVVRALTSPSPPGRAIAAGSLTTVSLARAAAKSGTLHKYGLPLGVILGLAVGAGAALVAERMDRRVDDIEALAAAAGCSSTMIPGGISHGELARALERDGAQPVRVLALRPRDAQAAADLRRSLAASAASIARTPTENGSHAGNHGSQAGDHAGNGNQAGNHGNHAQNGKRDHDAVRAADAGHGRTMLVVGRGEHAAAVAEAAGRLRLVGQDPAFAVLLCGSSSG